MKLKDTTRLEKFLQELKKEYIEEKEKAKDSFRIAKIEEGVSMVSAVEYMLQECPEHEVCRANIVDSEKPISESALFVADKTPCESMSTEPENVIRHRIILSAMNDLYAKKNADYGDSFHKIYEEWGMPMALIRLEDKLNRAKTLVKKGTQEVSDESLRDTLMDLANYSIMTIMELDREAAVE